MELVSLMRQSGYKNIDTQINFLKEHLYNLCQCSESSKNELNHTISHFTSQYKQKWFQSHRTYEKFTSNNKNWLETVIHFPLYDNTEKKKRGRQSLSFSEASDTTKRKKTQELRQNYSVDELSYATQMSLRSVGQIDASKLVNEVTSTSPRRALRYRKALTDVEKHKHITMTGEEALSTMIEAKLSRRQYEVVRSKDKKRFPSYKVIQEAKKLCYPKIESIVVNSTSVEVKLQALLDHTASRLVVSLSEVILSRHTDGDFTLIYKWGFDGSSGLNPYKQKHSETEGDCIDIDSSVFLSSLVPLRLITGDLKLNATVFWQNPRPSSTRYCRPIRMQFKRETTELSIAEKTYMDCQISAIQPTVIELENRNIIVKHNLIFTMVDGKVCNALTDTKSTQKCFLCGATSKQFNKIDEVLEMEVKSDYLQFGLSILHGWIRCFECLLHIAYKIPIQSWQARGVESKKIVSENKKRIQKEFKEKLGLLVDRPKQGFGNSNDGNTARRFFKNPEVSASITGLDCDLIERFRNILITISTVFDIDTNKFKIFCIETARLYVKKYPWYVMPPTVHKLLIHGSEVISKSLLPIGQLSEEAQEARHKDLKRFREDFSRKCDREKTNEDIFRRLLISSDPIITSYRHLPDKIIKKFPKAVLNMLLQSQPDEGESDDSDGSSDSEDED